MSQEHVLQQIQALLNAELPPANFVTKRLSLEEFPQWVIKRLVSMAARGCPEEFRSLQDTMAAVHKQSVGAFADTASEGRPITIHVTEPLTATPRVEGERALAASPGAPGQSAVHTPDATVPGTAGDMTELFEKLRGLEAKIHEKLDAVLGKPESKKQAKPKEPETPEEPMKPEKQRNPRQPAAEDDENGTSDKRDDEKVDKPEKQKEEEDEKRPTKRKGEENELPAKRGAGEEEPEKRRTPMTEDVSQQKPAQKRETDGRGDNVWPTDLGDNPAEPLHKEDDWGPDPDHE